MKRQVVQQPYILTGGRLDAPTSGVIYAFHDDHLVASQSNAHRNGHYLSGGRLYIRKRHWYPYVAPLLTWWKSGLYYTRTPYYGFASLVPIPTEDLYDPGFDMTNHFVEAMGHGATGWARARPGNPVAGLSVFTGELRKLPQLPFKMRWRDVPDSQLPRRLFHRLKNFRSLGSEYLNVVFGWTPFVKDVIKMYETYRTIDRHLTQITRNNGKGIRRSRLIRDDHSVTVSESTEPFAFYGWGNAFPNWQSGSSTVIRETKTVDKIWFDAQFRYYFAEMKSSEWTRRTTRALFGANVTPEVLWNLLPWSWLIDYFSNVGDIVTNYSSNAVDNLTADYAYIMRTIEHRVTDTASTRWAAGSGFRTGYPAGSLTGVSVSETITKMRDAATPYGFGVSFDGLSPYKQSVIAALGISRSKF